MSECQAVLCELDAQLAGAKALIGIEHCDVDPDGSLLQATRLLDKALAMSAELLELLEPEARAAA